MIRVQQLKQGSFPELFIETVLSDESDIFAKDFFTLFSEKIIIDKCFFSF
mgnify:FL=1